MARFWRLDAQGLNKIRILARTAPNPESLRAGDALVSDYGEASARDAVRKMSRSG